MLKHSYPDARMRVWLDKPDGGLRPLTIPTHRDRIREAALRLIAEIVAAPWQSQSSIGFRFNQDRHRGLYTFLSRALRKWGLSGFNIIDTDFKK
jgi:retron-type reverse transcriptase